MATEAQIKELKKRAQQLRYNVLEMIGIGVAGHWGGSASLAETMAVLYFHVMNARTPTIRAPDRDRLLLSRDTRRSSSTLRSANAVISARRTAAVQGTERAVAGASGPQHSRHRSCHRISRPGPVDRCRHGARPSDSTRKPIASTSSWATAKTIRRPALGSRHGCQQLPTSIT